MERSDLFAGHYFIAGFSSVQWEMGLLLGRDDVAFKGEADGVFSKGVRLLSMMSKFERLDDDVSSDGTTAAHAFAVL